MRRSEQVALSDLILFIVAGLSSAQASQEPREGDFLFEGYTLFNPLRSFETLLVDMDGRVVHKWRGDAPVGNAVYLLESGNLLRTERVQSLRFRAGGTGGRVREYTWDGEILWEYQHASDAFHHHHDVKRLPNGNVILISWELKTREEAIKAGRHPKHVGDSLWSEALIEIDSSNPLDIKVVWEWHLWDHLIQDWDPEKDNYGDVGGSPSRLDINADCSEAVISAKERSALEALGYLEPDLDSEAPPGWVRSDWIHLNALDYQSDRDEIVISSRGMNEIYVIDHSTNTDEARGSSGGLRRRGGDFLYRWGHPKNYRSGTSADQKFFGQHDPTWIKGTNSICILVFNNGEGRPDGSYSTVDQIQWPIDKENAYILEQGEAYGPKYLAWQYKGNPPESFFAPFLSGAQRLPNGNTLICDGMNRVIFEVNREGRRLWEYQTSPKDGKGINDGAMISGLFRATRYGSHYPAFEGKTLEPIGKGR